MQNLLIAVSLAAAVSQTPSPRGGVTRSDAVLVRYVFDGDTIDVATIGRVRLLGIDAPETGRGFDTPAPFAAAARARLTALVLRRWVRLEYDGARTDAYNRRLAYVFTEDGQFANAVLVREGLARVSARTRLSRLNELQRAQADAQASRRGMWRLVLSEPGAPDRRVEGVILAERQAAQLPRPRSQTPSAWRWPPLITRP